MHVMRLLVFICLLFAGASQSQSDYVCSTADFRRLMSSSRARVELLYSSVITSCIQLADALTFASSHPNPMCPPSLYQSSQLLSCKPRVPDQLWLPDDTRLFDVYVLNRSGQGIPFDARTLDSEMGFVSPAANFLETMLSHNQDAVSVYFVGLAMNCSTVYYFPPKTPRGLCGLMPPVDVCSYFNERYNLYSKVEDLEQDYQQQGHWSEPYADYAGKGNLVTYSIPVKDKSGVFRGQVAMDVNLTGIRGLIEKLKPSANGFTFIMSREGHVIFAQQEVINILFGPEANLTLKMITDPFINLGLQASVVAAVPIRQAKTVFANLPDALGAEQDTEGSLFISTSIYSSSAFSSTNIATDENGVSVSSNGGNSGSSSSSQINEDRTNEGYYVEWTQFERTLKNWYLIGIIPRAEIDDAAEWSVSPEVLNVTLSDLKPEANVTVYARNLGSLPFAFAVSYDLQTRGIHFTSQQPSRFRLLPGDWKPVIFQIRIDLARASTTSSSAHFVVPFYANPTGYGLCFKPKMIEIDVHVERVYLQIPSTQSFIGVTVLCGVTVVMVLVAFGLLFLYRYSAPVLALAPRILSLSLLGVIFALASSVLNIWRPSVLLCHISRWLFHIGFDLSVATIAAKNFRTRCIFDSKSLQVVALTDKQLLAFIILVVCVDAILLMVGTFVEPCVLLTNGQCQHSGWVVYSLLIVTKVLVWGAAFRNTMAIANVPRAFSDTKLNGVLALIAILTLIYLGLQFSDLLSDPAQLLAIGSLFVWFAAFLTCAHFLFKLKSGYVTSGKERKPSGKGSSSGKSNQKSSQVRSPRFKERLDALLAEVEAQEQKLMMEKNNATENMKTNQRLLFEIRAEILALDTQANLADEELERYLPATVKAAFERFAPAISRRLNVGVRLPTARSSNRKSTANSVFSDDTLPPSIDGKLIEIPSILTHAESDEIAGLLLPSRDVTTQPKFDLLLPSPKVTAENCDPPLFSSLVSDSEDSPGRISERSDEVTVHVLKKTS